VTADDIEVQVVRGLDALESVRPAWTSLASHDVSRTPLTGPDFLIPMRAALARNVEPCCLLALAQGRPVGLLPLGIARVRKGLVTLRRVVPFAGRHSYFTDAVLSPDAPELVAASLAHALARVAAAADDLLLMRVPSDRPLGAALAAMPGFECVATLRNRVAPPAFLEGRAGQELRRRLRRLAEIAVVETREIVAPDEVAERFHAFAELHTAMAPERGLDPVFADADDARQMAHLLRERAHAGAVGIVELRIDGQLIASQVWLRDGGTFLAYRSAWATAWSPYAIGLHVINELVRTVVRGEGTALEIGPGDEAYKLGWGPTSQTALRVRVVNRTWRQRVAWWTRRWDPEHHQPAIAEG
jgi:CelD/BcsL family acetyltransferase involved in cellulose biosynthesis